MFYKTVALLAIVGLLQTQVCIAGPLEEKTNNKVPGICGFLAQNVGVILTQLKDFKGEVRPSEILPTLLNALQCVGSRPDLDGCIEEALKPILDHTHPQWGPYYQTLFEALKLFPATIQACSMDEDSR